MSILVQQVIYRKPKFRITILINNWGSKLADFSYTFYHIHLPIVYLLIHFGFPKSESVNTLSLSYYLCAVIICLISAYIIYFFLKREQNMSKEF